MDQGVEPGWALLEDEDGDVLVMDADEVRVIQYLPDVDAGPDRPMFACWGRPDERYDFSVRGYVTGYAYATEWLNGGNPGTMLVSMTKPENIEGSL